MLVEFGGVDAPVPRHAEVEDQSVAAIGRNEPIFCPPSEAGDPRPGQSLAKVLRHRSAQVGPARLDPYEPPAPEDGLQPADGGFDFGKFRHQPVIARSGATKQSS